jgi:hypothetical protein
MKHLSMSANSGIRSSGTCDIEGYSGQFVQSFFNGPLNGSIDSLPLPSMKFPAVIGGDESHSLDLGGFMVGINWLDL